MELPLIIAGFLAIAAGIAYCYKQAQEIGFAVPERNPQPNAT